MLFLSLSSAFAGERVGVEHTSDVTVITGDEIRGLNVFFVTDFLRSVPELTLAQKGGTGKPASVFLRGGEPEHALVTIDGVKVNSALSGDFDFSGLPVDGIERIEIIKGPQSVFYGSEAMAGAVNVITKKRVEGRPKVDASFEAGSFGTYKPAAGISGGGNSYDYRLSASYFDTGGISAAASGTEKDGYENASLSGRFGLKPSGRFDLELSGRYADERSELDGLDSPTRAAADDENFVRDAARYLLSARGRLYAAGKWEQILTLSTQRENAEFRDPDTTANNADLEFGRDVIEWRHSVPSGPYILTAGAEYREDRGRHGGRFDDSAVNRAAYFNTRFMKEGLTLDVGVRYDDHDTAGDKTTWKISAVEQRESGITFRAAYGTGFRPPSFDELFFAGDSALRAEESSAWEFGFDKVLTGATALSVTYFEQDYENLIETDPAALAARNVSGAGIKGVEAGLSHRLSDTLALRGGYTHLDTENAETGQRLSLRPEDRFTLGAIYSIERFSLFADYTYVGERFDSAADRRLGSYNIVDLSGSFKLTKAISLAARAENLLDEEYEEAGGYGRPGLSMYGGVRASF